MKLVTAIVPNISVIDNDICIIYGYMLFYILQKCALILDIILKRGRFLSTSVSRIVDSVSINFNAFIFRGYYDIDKYNVRFGPIIL